MRTRRLIIAPEPGLLAPLRQRAEQAAEELAQRVEQYGPHEEITNLFRNHAIRCEIRLRHAEHGHHLGAKLFAV